MKMQWQLENGSAVLLFDEAKSKLTITPNPNQNPWIKSGVEPIKIIDELEAEENIESSLQLLEGCSYYYDLSEEYTLSAVDAGSDIVDQNPRHNNEGRILTGIYVGCLVFQITDSAGKTTDVPVEVRSIKADYRSDYQQMLQDITKHCVGLIYQHTSPAKQHVAVDYSANADTLYQRFAFVQSLIDSPDFYSSIQRIVSMPVSSWCAVEKVTDIRRAGKLNHSDIRQIASCQNRITLPPELQSDIGISSLPQKINHAEKEITFDTPENRFIKYVLWQYQSFLRMVHLCIEKNNQTNLSIFAQVEHLEKNINRYISQSFFRSIPLPQMLELNSPVLQRKEGYREIYQGWLMFDLASRLIWKNVDEYKYTIGKRDVASLYEYWVFFKLRDIVSEVFSLKGKDDPELLKETDGGMGLQLKEGNHIVLQGTTVIKNRALHIQFHYNKTFGVTDYPESGSWTQTMRPDYTISIWPDAFTETQAEEQEEIVYIHFDAKYRVEGLQYLFEKKDDQSNNDLTTEDTLAEEKLDERRGIYKRADLLKMHAYKDAIRRTAGAYIIYPGTVSKEYKGFREILPGLGAFPLLPTADSEDGSSAIKKFLNEVIDNVTNRMSQREESSYYTYKINKYPPLELHDSISESDEKGRIVPVRTISVLIGYYRAEQYNWICKNRLYNIRVSRENGLEQYGKSELGAAFLLLHGAKESKSADKVWKIVSESPVLMTKQELKDIDYPNPSVDNYLVFHLEEVEKNSFFKKYTWDITKMKPMDKHEYTYPFAVSFADFMKGKMIEK